MGTPTAALADRRKVIIIAVHAAFGTLTVVVSISGFLQSVRSVTFKLRRVRIAAISIPHRIGTLKSVSIVRMSACRIWTFAQTALRNDSHKILKKVLELHSDGAKIRA